MKYWKGSFLFNFSSQSIWKDCRRRISVFVQSDRNKFEIKEMAKNSKNDIQILFFFEIIAMNKNKKIYNFSFFVCRQIYEA